MKAWTNTWDQARWWRIWLYWQETQWNQAADNPVRFQERSRAALLHDMTKPNKKTSNNNTLNCKRWRLLIETLSLRKAETSDATTVSPEENKIAPTSSVPDVHFHGQTTNQWHQSTQHSPLHPDFVRSITTTIRYFPSIPPVVQTSRASARKAFIVTVDADRWRWLRENTKTQLLS